MTWECPSCGFIRNEYVDDICMCGHQIRASHKEIENTEVGDNTYIVISQKPQRYWLGIIVILLMTVYIIFGAVLPVLLTGDYSSVWPVSDKRRIGRDICIFYAGLVWLFCIPSVIRSVLSAGEYRFYEDRIVNRPILTGLERTFFYKNITVNQHGLLRITFYPRDLPGWINPLRQLKVLFIDGGGFSIRRPPYGHVEPEQRENIINLLKSRTDYRIKCPS